MHGGTQRQYRGCCFGPPATIARTESLPTRTTHWRRTPHDRPLVPPAAGMDRAEFLCPRIAFSASQLGQENLTAVTGPWPVDARRGQVPPRARPQEGLVAAPAQRIQQHTPPPSTARRPHHGPAVAVRPPRRDRLPPRVHQPAPQERASFRPAAPAVQGRQPQPRCPSPLRSPGTSSPAFSYSRPKRRAAKQPTSSQLSCPSQHACPGRGTNPPRTDSALHAGRLSTDQDAQHWDAGAD